LSLVEVACHGFHGNWPPEKEEFVSRNFSFRNDGGDVLGQWARKRLTSFSFDAELMKRCGAFVGRRAQSCQGCFYAFLEIQSFLGSGLMWSSLHFK